jgi:hypothetical protein
MTKRRTGLIGGLAVLLAASGLLVYLRGEGGCEALAARGAWGEAATVCAQTYQRTGAAAAALQAVHGASMLGRATEVEARLPWLEGTAFAAAIPYYRALSAGAKGDDAEAMRLYGEALGASRGAQLHEYAARAAHQLTSLQWTHGQFQAAFATLAVGSAEAQQTDNRRLKLYLEGQLADLLGEVGELAAQARALHGLAQGFAGEPGTLAQVRLRQGRVELERSNVGLARDYFEAALAGALDAGYAPVARSAHVNLATLALLAGDLDAGAAHLSAAEMIPALQRYEETTWAYAKAQQLQARGEYPAARAVAEAALDGGALPDWQWQLRTVAGRCAEEEGDLEGATASFTEATAVIEQLRREEPTAALRTGLLALRREPYEALFELAVRAGDSARALGLMEQLLSRAFSEAMVAQKLEAPLDLTTASGVAERRLTALQTQAPASSLAAVPLKSLGARDAVAFLAARGTLYRAHVSAGRVAFSRVARLREVEGLIERLEAAPDELVAAEALGELLWPSGLAERVLIAADGPLANLSFAGLRRGGRWVVEDHVISRVPSLGAAALLASQGLRPAGDGTRRVLGDPKGDLPAAAREAVALAERLGVRAILGAEATTEALLASCRADLLHFAGHSGIGPEGGWLALADGEVSAVRLLSEGCRPRMVYLASCASAVRGRGQMAGTVADAFFASGSAHVVATTRSVDDGVAAIVARDFFSEAGFDERPAERLALVQRALSRTLPRSAWASFVVLGP